MPSKITEKKLKNKRFRRTEESLLAALLVTRDTVSLERLIRLARISRSTIYRHHGTVQKIVPNYHEYIMAKYKRMLKSLFKIKHIRIKSIYHSILDFLKTYQQIIDFPYHNGDSRIIEEMLLLLEPKIIDFGKIADKDTFAIYTKGISAVIEKWISDGFNKSDIPRVVEKIIYLTNTAKPYLAPIAD